MITATVSTIAKAWKQAKCPSAEEWIKMSWCMYTMEYYSAINKSGIMPFAATWTNAEHIRLSEVNQTEEDKYHITHVGSKK